jgi:hypothetical protein
MALTFKGQRFALLKTAPGGFLFAAIHGAHLQRPTLCVVKNRSGRFFYSQPSMALTFKGQRFALLKTAPGGFLSFWALKKSTIRLRYDPMRSNVILN